MAISSGLYSAPLSVLLYNADGSFRTPYYLVTIELPAFGANPATTLHLSSPGYTGPDGQPWDDAIGQVGQVNASGAWLTPRWNPADLDIIVLDKRITGQAVGETLSDLLAAYDFVGAPVLVQIAFENTVSVTDYATVFQGRIVEWRDLNAVRFTLYCEQDRTWSQTIPKRKIDKADFPYAPTDSIGLPRPIIVGDWNTGSRDIPNLSSGFESAQAGVARAAYPVVIVEQESATGGLTTPKVMVSDYDMHTDPTRLLLYERALDTFAYSVDAPTITGTGPTYAQLASYQFYVPILATDNNTGTTTAANWQELIRKDKPYTLDGRCTLNFDSGYKVLSLLMPEISELGTFVGAQVFVWYAKNATTGTPTVTKPRFGVKQPINGDGLADFPDAATSPTSDTIPRGFSAVNVGPAATGGSDSIQGWDDIQNAILYADVGLATQAVEIHRLALVVLYRPNARIIRSGVRRTSIDASKFPRAGHSGFRTRMNPFDYSNSTPDLESFDAPLYAYGKGVPDSGHASGAADGHYTGTSGAVIEHPADVAHWSLRELGGTTAITTTASEFGSFTDARTALSAYKMKAQISQEQDVESFIEDIGKEFLVWIFRRTTDPASPFVCIPWTEGAAQDYRSASDLVTFNREGAYVLRDSLRVSRTPTSSVANLVRVNFDYDPRAKTFGEQVYITDTESRVYFAFGLWTTDGTREAEAVSSVARHGRKELTMNLKWVRDPATASNILRRLFDWRIEPRVVVKFISYLNAVDLERGHVIQMGSDWDSFLPYPKAGSNGSWSGKNLRVFSVVKLAGLPVQHEITAIEI